MNNVESEMSWSIFHHVGGRTVTGSHQGNFCACPTGPCHLGLFPAQSADSRNVCCENPQLRFSGCHSQLSWRGWARDGQLATLKLSLVPAHFYSLGNPEFSPDSPLSLFPLSWKPLIFSVMSRTTIVVDFWDSVTQNNNQNEKRFHLIGILALSTISYDWALIILITGNIDKFVACYKQGHSEESIIPGNDCWQTRFFATRGQSLYSFSIAGKRWN